MAESVQIAAVSNRHEHIADILLANPTMSRTAIAKKIGVSLSWLSIVTHSDVFVEYFAKRRAVFNEEMTKKITDAHLDLTLTTIGELKDEVLKTDTKPEFKLAVAEHTLKALGYEPRARVKVTETKTIEHSSPVDADLLADSRARMTRRSSVTIEHEGSAPATPTT